MKQYFLLLFTILIGCSDSKPKLEKPKVSFTFDDGSTANKMGLNSLEWNQMILNHLENADLKAVFFVTTSYLEGLTGDSIIKSWDNQGHKIGNHTYSHPFYHSPKISYEFFKNEFLKADSSIRRWNNYFQYFRFPYLKEGNTTKKRDKFRELLKQNNYKNGHVSIDASDWYVESRMVKNCSSINDLKVKVDEYKKYFLNHIYERSLFYDSIATEITGRKINHVLLLHHNVTSALFLDDLIKMYNEKGWEIVDADKALEDDFYNITPDRIPAGESLVWSIAKQSGKFEKVLRYPAEGAKYESAKMDSLGL